MELYITIILLGLFTLAFYLYNDHQLKESQKRMVEWIQHIRKTHPVVKAYLKGNKQEKLAIEAAIKKARLKKRKKK